MSSLTPEQPMSVAAEHHMSEALAAQLAQFSQQIEHERDAFTDSLTAMREQRNIHADEVVQLRAQLIGMDRLHKQITIALADRATQIATLQARIVELEARLLNPANNIATTPSRESPHG